MTTDELDSIMAQAGFIKGEVCYTKTLTQTQTMVVNGQQQVQTTDIVFKAVDEGEYEIDDIVMGRLVSLSDDSQQYGTFSIRNVDDVKEIFEPKKQKRKR